MVSRVIRLIRAQILPDTGGQGRGDRTREHEWKTRDHGTDDFGRQAATAAEGVDQELAALYSNLEVPYGSDLSTVRKAWKGLLRRYHPDLHSKDPGKREIAGELTRRLNGAYETLEERLKSETNRQEK
jgi:DnaJ-class molecular chaperone